MLMSSGTRDNSNRSIERLIRRERVVWLGGVTIPIMLLIAFFVL